ncbi:MAG: DUF5050 domain-containing protein [Clostridia bacterium]|nr:DUF5050 domain-containing protein [Clostridia bacterium]
MGEKKTQKSKWNIVLIVGIVILAIAILLICSGSLRHAILRLFGIEAKDGNTAGNINNLGYAAEDGKYLYYMAPNSNGQYIGINKVKKSDLTGEQIRLVEGTWEIASINSYGDYIYFVTLSQNQVDENDTTADEVDNKIHRVKKNGDQKDEVLNDNEFNNYAYKIAVTGGKIYYIGEDECIWYMDLDGKNKTKMNENATGFELVTNKYIIYNMPKVENGKETSVTYIMDRSGKNAREVNGERLFTPIIYKDYIYYLTEDRYLHRIGLDGKNDEMLSDAKIYNLNVSDNGVYYFNEIKSQTTGATQALALYRMDLDGKNNKKIYTLEESSNSLCLLEDWVFFLDSNDEEGRMEIVSPDGKQKIDLFALYYADYYYLDELIEERKNELEEAEETVTEEGASEETTENVAE